jgi:hypothetical protein
MIGERAKKWVTVLTVMDLRTSYFLNKLYLKPSTGRFSMAQNVPTAVDGHSDDQTTFSFTEYEVSFVAVFKTFPNSI